MKYTELCGPPGPPSGIVDLVQGTVARAAATKNVSESICATVEVTFFLHCKKKR
jgi:hypothetical protein